MSKCLILSPKLYWKSFLNKGCLVLRAGQRVSVRKSETDSIAEQRIVTISHKQYVNSHLTMIHMATLDLLKWLCNIFRGLSAVSVTSIIPTACLVCRLILCTLSIWGQFYCLSVMQCEETITFNNNFILNLSLIDPNSCLLNIRLFLHSIWTPSDVKNV